MERRKMKFRNCDECGIYDGKVDDGKKWELTGRQKEGKKEREERKKGRKENRKRGRREARKKGSQEEEKPGSRRKTGRQNTRRIQELPELKNLNSTLDRSPYR